MSGNKRNILLEWIPPAAMTLLRKMAGRTMFRGDYPSWKTARMASTGYDSDAILTKVRDAARKVRDGQAAYERDSVLFDAIQYSWPLLACLLWVASQKENRLNLVDFGGSLGTTYYQNRKFLSHLKEIHWNVVEQKFFVECGKREFENEHLKFHEDIEQCYKEHRPDVILFSSVIQYLENPYDLLEKVQSLEVEFILFDRTSFLQKGNDRITVQQIPQEIFPASYPCWFLSQEKFIDAMSARYLLVAEFAGFEKADVKDSVFKGFIFRRK